MTFWLDTLLVFVAVAAAVFYLIRRKRKSTRQVLRDWSTGRAEQCGSCPVRKIREAQASHLMQK
ncbi:hypothetical protein EHM69_05765 [candidate division KSB1 bacterium]|nr:MAG: hypothetical protein EHM69_05765 [candidate division KSB1 bacterium]